MDSRNLGAMPVTDNISGDRLKFVLAAVQARSTMNDQSRANSACGFRAWGRRGGPRWR
jgi:hypothetical protein